MQNTTENTAVLEKNPEAAVPSEKPAQQVTEQVSSMAEQLEATAPEKRRVFRKACNHTARSVLFQMLIMYAVAFVAVFGYMLYGMLSNPEAMSALMGGDMTAYAEYINSMLLDPAFILTSFAASAVGGTLANLWAGFLHAKKRGYKPFESLGEGRMTVGLFGGGIVTALGAMYIWMYAYMLICYLTGYTDPSQAAAAQQSEILLSVKSPVAMAVYCLYVCVLAPFTEEYLFRGVLLKTLSKYNVGFAAFATSLLFGLLHGNLQQTPSAFLGGLVLAYVAIRSGSIRTPIIIHMIVNIYGTVISALSVNMPQHEQVISIVHIVLTSVFAVGAAAIVISGLARKTLKWEAVEPTTNHTLLPKVESRAKFHLGHFFTCFWVVLFIYIAVELILSVGGFTPLYQLVFDLAMSLVG